MNYTVIELYQKGYPIYKIAEILHMSVDDVEYEVHKYLRG